MGSEEQTKGNTAETIDTNKLRRVSFASYVTLLLLLLALQTLTPSSPSSSYPTMTTKFLVSSLASSTANSCPATMPALGLGSYLLQRENVSMAISSALQLGYRRIDCAPVYFNEDAIGDALSEILASDQNNISRSDIFVASKLASPFHTQVERGLRKTLMDLRLDYLDLYMIHWPVAFVPIEGLDLTRRGWVDEVIDESDGGNRIDPSVSVHDTWKQMEDMVDLGLVKHIGVSNFPVMLLHELMSKARIAPAVNQVEIHPYLQQQKLVDYCQKRGVAVQAYSPLGTPGYHESDEPRVMEDSVLQSIASAHGKSVAQVCLQWAIQRGASVVVKATSPSHQRENLGVTLDDSSFNLTNEDMDAISKLDRDYRYFRPEEWWGALGMAVFE
mmetsp:Transcript_38003/g.56517  ORF Transcript_38003/g.56517 Transcript_38003/m.56517 type:complete len:387 (-) Transcript_38003:626-1786(-)